MARLLTVPYGYTDPYAPTTQELQTLAAALSGTSSAIVINQTAESFSLEYPSLNDVINFINSGGVYIDYCGWPMYFGNALKIPGPTSFGIFLDNIGADSAYCDGFAVSGCGGYPYDRGWMTRGNITNAAGLIYGTGGVLCSSGETAYPLVAVKSTGGSGIYFYGAAGSNGAVDPNQFAQFILSIVSPPQGGSGAGNNSGTGGCQAGYTRNSSGVCVPLTGISQQQCLAGGGTWVTGICQTKSGSVQPPATKTNWPLIIGGGVVLVGIVVAAVALTGGK